MAFTRSNTSSISAKANRIINKVRPGPDPKRKKYTMRKQVRTVRKTAPAIRQALESKKLNMLSHRLPILYLFVFVGYSESFFFKGPSSSAMINSPASIIPKAILGLTTVPRIKQRPKRMQIEPMKTFSFFLSSLLMSREFL